MSFILCLRICCAILALLEVERGEGGDIAGAAWEAADFTPRRNLSHVDANVLTAAL